MVDRSPLFLPFRKETRRLRTGIVVEKAPARWIHDLLEFLEEIPLLEVSVFAVGETGPELPIPELTRRLYETSRQRFDAFSKTSVTSEPIEALTNFGLDVVVWLAPLNTLPARCADLARFGIITARLGEETSAPPFSAEVFHRQLTSSCVIYWHDASRTHARVVRSGEVKTEEALFFTRNAEEPLVAAQRMIAEILLDIAEHGEQWKSRVSALPVEERTLGSQSYPSNLASFRFLARQAVRSVRLRAQQRGRSFAWFTMIRRRPSLFYSNTGRLVSDGWEEIPGPTPGTEIADPFVFEYGGKSWLFYEEIPSGTTKAHLSCMEVTPAGFGPSHTVLSRPYHLSYPCVFEHRGDVFMLPETADGHNVQLYKATRFPYEFEPVAILMDGVMLVDTTPFLLDSIWYFFTTTAQPFMETFLFWSDALDGKWRMHPSSPISASVRNSRSAGNLFYNQGRLLRPTQDCAVRYGHSMTINEVRRLSPVEFEEVAVDTIQPDWTPGLLATHTLNASSGLEVIDGLRYKAE